MTMNTRIVAAALGGLLIAGGAWAVQESISQKGKMFTPDELSREVGGLVRINNDDSIPHNIQVTNPDGENKNFGLQMPGNHADVAIEKPGDYMVRCGIHPKMKLVLHAR